MFWQCVERVPAGKVITGTQHDFMSARSNGWPLGALGTAGPTPTASIRTPKAVADDTSPSLVEMKTGGWEAYHQSTNGHLAGAGILGNFVSRFAMAPDTSPSFRRYP